MQYQINGVKVTVLEECGIYKFDPNRSIIDYARMDTDKLVQTINDFSPIAAIQVVTALQNMAAEQAQWRSAPRNPGYPILRGPEPQPIDQVRSYIQNTEIFTRDILAALQRR